MNETKIVVLGAGESGTGSAILAKKKGFKVFVSDKGKITEKYKNVLSNYEIDFEEGKHSEAIILDANEVIKSPGIPDHINIIKKIKENGINVISEIEFAGRFTNAYKICITGSNGKTTTTLLTYHILKNSGLNVGLAGNVGESFAWQVAENDFDFYVLELSSFQLDGMFDFRANIAILLNITPDHLDRYNDDFEKYVDSKFRILQNQTKNDAFIYNTADPVIVNRLKSQKVEANKFPFSINQIIKGNGAYANDKELIVQIKSNIIINLLGI